VGVEMKFDKKDGLLYELQQYTEDNAWIIQHELSASGEPLCP